MFQRPALLPWRSVLSNVMLPVEIDGGAATASAGRRTGTGPIELLEMVGLQGFERRLPHELSGGMQQRVSLCRSLIRDPQVMLMDEPFSALDALTRTELSEELQRIKMELSTTIVFVTHSIEEAVVLADRVVVLTPRPGRMREVVDIDIPRPRSLGQNAHLTEVARISGLLHGLLAEKTAQATPGRRGAAAMTKRSWLTSSPAAAVLLPIDRPGRRDRAVVAGHGRVLDRAVPAAQPG